MKGRIALLLLYISFPFARADDLLIDGGISGWDENSWRVTVDGVMGGRSTGRLRFDNDEDGVPTTMVFSGDIINTGGGFSSVRRWFRGNNILDLSSYAGIAVEVEPLEVSAEQIRAPLGLHLQLHDTRSYWSFASAFAVPLKTVDDESVTSTTTIFLPMESFDRGSRMGWKCRRCSLDKSSINGMDIYVLFQEGNFEVKVKSVTAVRDVQSYQSPNVEFGSSDDIVNFLYATIRSGGNLYNIDYRELCNSIYWSSINSIVQSSSSAVTPAFKHVACAGLQEISRIAKEETNVANRKQDIAWTLRYTMDAMIADLEGASRSMDHDWLPSVQIGIADNEENQQSCGGFTSMVPVRT